jgi:hypothetical protein
MRLLLVETSGTVRNYFFPSIDDFLTREQSIPKNSQSFAGIPAHTDMEQWRTIDRARSTFRPYPRSAPPSSFSSPGQASARLRAAPQRPARRRIRSVFGSRRSPGPQLTGDGRVSRRLASMARDGRVPRQSASMAGIGSAMQGRRRPEGLKWRWWLDGDGRIAMVGGVTAKMAAAATENGGS